MRILMVSQLLPYLPSHDSFRLLHNPTQARARDEVAA
jgi:hypothetical protein